MSALSLESFITRRVSYPRPGSSVDLSLSQSLFSSHEVDRGSSLLLKSLEKALFASTPRILDVGSGTGVIGIALARSVPGARLWFQDRDALAIAFTELNCSSNRIVAERLQGELGLQGLGGNRFDLIVSNLPAKAGEAVHADLMRRTRSHLAPGGLACFVVVKPLADRLEAAMDAAGLTPEPAVATAAHAVFHARATGLPAEDSVPELPAPEDGAGPGSPDPLRSYLRGRRGFRLGAVVREMDVVFDLPEFDTLSYGTELALDMAAEAALEPCLAGRLLVWNPGQGHVPAGVAELARGADRAAPLPLTLAGRDLLALRVSARNAASASRRWGSPRCAHVWNPATIPGTYSLMFLFPEDEPHVRWDEYLPGFASERLEHDSYAIVTAGATFVGRMLRHTGTLELRKSRKKDGMRCVLLRKP